MTYAIHTSIGSNDGTRERRVFWVPDGGGYVHEVTHQPGTLGPQVCRRLRGSGDTLRATADTLPTVIQRELRLARADARRMGL